MTKKEIKKFKEQHAVFFYHKAKVDKDRKKYGTVLVEHQASMSVMRDLMSRWSEEEKYTYYKIIHEEGIKMIDIENIKDNTLYTLQDASKILEINKTVLLRKTLNNEIKSKKLNKKKYILGIDIKDYINKNLK